MHQFQYAALGGTFDHFHKGHQTLIKHAFSIAEKVVIGITEDKLVEHKQYTDNIETYNLRLKKVNKFLENNNFKKNCTLIKLNDIFGPTLTDTKIDCLVVSPLTKPGADLINHSRQKKGLNKLPISVCHLEKSKDGQYISSTRIRKGEINQKGFIFFEIFKNDLALNDKQKQALKKPLGELIIKNTKANLENFLKHKPFSLAIGDQTSLFCYQNGIPIQLYIFDNHIQRKPIGSSIQHILASSNIKVIKNPAGMIKHNLAKEIKNLIDNHKHLKIIGEEDLAVIPAILLLPLGTIILYGQPQQGIVAVTVSEERKNWCFNLLTTF